MKILFSADWHLGYTLAGANPQPRLEDQRRNIDLIANYCEEHAVDVLAIAGDIFEAQQRGPARDAAAAMIDGLHAPLSRGMRIVGVAGNHDTDFFMETANIWLDAAAVSNQIIFRVRPELVTVEANGEQVNFALLPFPRTYRYDITHVDQGG